MKHRLEKSSLKYENREENKTSFLSVFIKEIIKLQVRRKNTIFFFKNIVTFILLISISVVFDLFQQFVIGFNQTAYLLPFTFVFFVLSILLLIFSKGLYKSYEDIPREDFIGNFVALTLVTSYSFYSLLILDNYTLLASVVVSICLILIDFIFSNINIIEENNTRHNSKFRIINYFTISFFACALLFINSELVIRDIATNSSL
ncbi:hypothetical protein Z971_16100, partial [Enterococcus faecium VRE0576]